MVPASGGEPASLSMPRTPIGVPLSALLTSRRARTTGALAETQVEVGGFPPVGSDVEPRRQQQHAAPVTLAARLLRQKLERRRPGQAWTHSVAALMKPPAGRRPRCAAVRRVQGSS